MDTKKIRKLQEVEMNLLLEADRICKELNINYYLIGGTLLGAVRHGGFIPWDMDIDIAMVREDYELFKAYCINNGHEDFFLQDQATEKYHPVLHALFRLNGTKVVFRHDLKERKRVANAGIYMDIFPLDFAPDSPREQNWQRRKIRVVARLLELKRCRDYTGGKVKYVIKRFLSVLAQLIPFELLQNYVERVMQQYNNGKREYIVSMASHYSYKKQYMPFEVYGEPRKIMFEGHEFSAPAKTEEYLTQLFGDYMQLPPVEKQRAMMETLEYVDFGKYATLEACND